MSEFGTQGSAPDWLNERFDKFTALPKGPLEHLPIPLEGQIVRASCAPHERFPKQWTVGIECAENVESALHFYHEYLPLSGYVIFAAGSLRTRRNWFGKTPPTAELLVVKRDGFVGTVTISNNAQEYLRTSIDVAMGDPAHEPFSCFADSIAIQELDNIQWRNYE